MMLKYSPEATTLKAMEGCCSGGVSGGPEMRAVTIVITAGQNKQGDLITCYPAQGGVGLSALPVEVDGLLTNTITV
jgi:hypothetical protein